MKFNHVTVLSRNTEKKSQPPYYNCICDCGRTFVRRKDGIYNPNNKTCGYCQREHHDASNTRLYNIYENMLARCYKKYAKHYDNYGGRGIKVCDEWKNSFVSFKKWAMTNGYHDNLTLDRKNNDGDYEPSNCRWATRKEQARNVRNNRLVLYNGIAKPLSEWCEILGIKISGVRKRLNKTNNDLTKALSLPKGYQYNHKPVDMFSINMVFIRTFDSPTECAEYVGSITNYKPRMGRIHDVCVGRRKSAYGYIYKYSTEVMKK